MTGEREKRAVARSKNRRQKSAQTQLPDRTLLEYARERQAVEKKVLEEERKELEEEKMKIEEERKRLAVEKVQVEKMRNEMDQKTKTQSRHSPVSHSHPVTNYHLQTAQTYPGICLIIEIHSEGIQVLGLLGFGTWKTQPNLVPVRLPRRQVLDPTMLGFADARKGQHKRSQKDNGSSCPLFKPHQEEDY
ncbi:hypothetical protein CAPTEDRAFT_212486 [Capitella teleta]|uniref:Uncharacterized protein n=1 Tax=Capitella teleta TaxID=283909 RepID=R7UTQ2_CAPTE|nr:hypothetical protein CAPTEDRAFT_212486 [Capitella teleta]|eukprot:ELU09528.1 hypothetical protein CAPTEDRAFT_212486 [Capitella teleta]